MLPEGNGRGGGGYAYQLKLDQLRGDDKNAVA